jgi:hypothetical protein
MVPCWRRIEPSTLVIADVIFGKYRHGSAATHPEGVSLFLRFHGGIIVDRGATGVIAIAGVCRPEKNVALEKFES